MACDATAGACDASGAVAVRGSLVAVADDEDNALRVYDTAAPGRPTQTVDTRPAMADAREGGIHFAAAGHYATETFGIRRLGELVAERFGVEQQFIDVPNPI